MLSGNKDTSRSSLGSAVSVSIHIQANSVDPDLTAPYLSKILGHLNS